MEFQTKWRKKKLKFVVLNSPHPSENGSQFTKVWFSSMLSLTEKIFSLKDSVLLFYCRRKYFQSSKNIHNILLPNISLLNTKLSGCHVMCQKNDKKYYWKRHLNLKDCRSFFQLFSETANEESLYNLVGNVLAY